MHFAYFAEQKLERFYDYLVERTEESSSKKSIREIGVGAEATGTAKFGKLLAMLGLADIDLDVNVSATGQVSFEKEVVSKFTAPQKLKALLVKLRKEGKLVTLTGNGEKDNLPAEGTPVFFAARLKTDYDKRSEANVEDMKAAVLTGSIGSVNLEIQASLAFMESMNAWRRWSQPREMVGLATLLGPSSDGSAIEFDPIILAYPLPS